MQKLVNIIKTEWQTKNILRRANLVLAASATIVCCIGIVKVGKSKLFKPSEAKISLTYEGASKGLNPNGTRFDPYLMISKNVVKKAEKSLGKDIDTSKLWVGLPTNSSSDSTATDYYLYYSGSDGENVLNAVVDAWGNMFENTYTESTASTDYEEFEDDTDYIYIADWIENEANQISSYAKTRLKKDNVWKSSDGISYQSLYDEIQNFINVDIADYRTYIIQNGITKDADALKQTIAYKDRLLQMKKDNYDAQYDNRREAITLYDPTLFPTISVPSISSGTYYITTTKTGLDYIYDAASVASSNSLDIQKTLSNDKLLIANMSGNNSSKEADEMVENLEKKINELSAKLQNTDTEYQETEEEPYYRVRISK